MTKVRYRVKLTKGGACHVVAEQWSVLECGALVFTDTVHGYDRVMVKAFADGTWIDVEPSEKS